MRNPRIFLLIATVTCASQAFACGPDLPNRLLFDRWDTLASLPMGSFEFEMRRVLGDPKDGLVAVERSSYDPPKAAAPPSLSSDDDKAADALYARAAEAFHASDQDRARGLFQQLVALPESQRGSRELASVYSIGRLEKMQVHRNAARAAFQSAFSR